MLYFYCLWISLLITRISSDSFFPDDMPVPITCYTCSEASSNDNCNRFAVDRPCPEDMSFCQIIHTMNSTGSTISVSKRCALSSECTKSQVGCVPMELESGQICVSCCDQEYCNDFVPTNETNAILQQTKGGAGTFTRSFSLKNMVLVIIMWILQKQQKNSCLA